MQPEPARKNDSGSCEGSGDRAGENEYSRTDDGADAERNQVYRAQHAAQAFAGFIVSFSQKEFEWFGGEKIRQRASPSRPGRIDSSVYPARLALYLA
jgi:hypothetical protein